MLLVDVLIVIVLILALIAGIRRGFFASIGTLIGLAAGAVAAYLLAPLVNVWVTSPAWRLVAVIATVIGLLFTGAALGTWVGSLLRSGADRLKLRWVERLLGGVASVVLAALALSLVAEPIGKLGMPGVSSALSSSYVLRTIESITPAPVQEAMATLGSAMFDEGIPALGDLLETETDAAVAGPTSPPVALDDPELAAAAASVARVSGTAYACGRGSTGSGFVVAPDRVVTNAHVVAGVDYPVVELPGQPARDGRIVYFDATNDLAVIAVDDLEVAPLARTATLSAGSPAAVVGYPLGGPLTTREATVISMGTPFVPDIYDEVSHPREIYALRAEVRPGNSGGPLLDGDGRVAGVVFARSETDDTEGYAMTMGVLDPVAELAPTLTDTVGSGRCTA